MIGEQAVKTEAVPEPRNEENTFTRVMTSNDVRYHILTLGKKAAIGFGEPITLVFCGEQCSKKMHNSTPGRIDGLKQLYQNHGITEGTILQVQCDFANKIIIIDKIE